MEKAEIVSMNITFRITEIDNGKYEMEVVDDFGRPIGSKLVDFVEDSSNVWVAVGDPDGEKEFVTNRGEMNKRIEEWFGNTELPEDDEILTRFHGFKVFKEMENEK